MVTIKRTSQLSILEKIDDRQVDRQGSGDDYHKITHILTALPSRHFCFPLYTFLYFAILYNNQKTKGLLKYISAEGKCVNLSRANYSQKGSSSLNTEGAKKKNKLSSDQRNQKQVQSKLLGELEQCERRERDT